MFEDFVSSNMKMHLCIRYEVHVFDGKKCKIHEVGQRNINRSSSWKKYLLTLMIGYHAWLVVLEWKSVEPQAPSLSQNVGYHASGKATYVFSVPSFIEHTIQQMLLLLRWFSVLSCWLYRNIGL